MPRAFASIPASDEATELTDAQILQQCRMYISAVRIADEFGCDAIGIQYQQGLKDLVPASDLVEGMLNNPERPPVWSEDGKRVLFAGRMLPHFNEVDECAGVDAVITNHCWNALNLDPSTTLHDVRWGKAFGDRLCGSGRSRVPHQLVTLSEVTQGRKATGSLRCISRLAVEH